MTALGKTVVKARTDPATGALSAVKIPDHVDILAELAIGANAHIVVSAATGLHQLPATLPCKSIHAQASRVDLISQ